MAYADISPYWEQFVAKGREIQAGQVRPMVLESWKRSRAFGADPYRDCAGRVDDEELIRRRERRFDGGDPGVRRAAGLQPLRRRPLRAELGGGGRGGGTALTGGIGGPINTLFGALTFDRGKVTVIK